MNPPFPQGARVGQILAQRYELVRFIGVGGMGEVYEARHSVIGRRFAIKMLRGDLTGRQGAEFAHRLYREAQTAGSVEHENVAAAVDFGAADDGTYFLAMEFLEGETLASLLARSGQLPVRRAVHIVLQACRGVAAAQAAGVIHRDIKPSNLFLCRRADGTDHVKVLDFGVAKVKSEVLLTQSGMMLGTPCYMSTEQARGAKHVDFSTDVYALGVVLYEALAGARPYEGDSYNEVLYHILAREPARLETRRSALPNGLSNVVHTAFAKESSDRYATAADLARKLEPFALAAVDARPFEASPNETTIDSDESVSAPLGSFRSLLSLVATSYEQSGDPRAVNLVRGLVNTLRKRTVLLAGVVAIAAVFCGAWLTNGTSREPPSLMLSNSLLLPLNSPSSSAAPAVLANAPPPVNSTPNAGQVSPAPPHDAPSRQSEPVAVENSELILPRQLEPQAPAGAQATAEPQVTAGAQATADASSRQGVGDVVANSRGVPRRPTSSSSSAPRPATPEVPGKRRFAILFARPAAPVGSVSTTGLPGRTRTAPALDRSPPF